MATQTKDLRSTGQLCADLQRPHGAIVRAIDELSIKPAFRLNGVAYFDEPAITTIAEALQRGRDDREPTR